MVKFQYEVVKKGFLTWRRNIAFRTSTIAAPPVPLAQMTRAVDGETRSFAKLGTQPRCGNAAVTTLFASKNTHEGFAVASIKPLIGGLAQRKDLRTECWILRNSL